ncbi:Tetratricopeptide repeat (TPR)-like superfamily protein [Forsythia ovata]|uniref:Tetratricopeptide repeat (TPR)-like superfamily protein n=1 Tax=Forsythia ovata TaxID=205694 RepID=A0ABD1P560_9LAMI
MWSDLLLQACIILVMVFMFLFIHNIPQNLFTKLRLFSRRANLQAKRHFVSGAQLLSQARSSKDSSRSSSLAKQAESEAEKAIHLDPKDAAAHILKALALELQGFRTSAIDSLDVALSPLAAKSLSDLERGDALYKRAELRFSVSQHGRVDSVVEDLVESVRLKTDNPNAFSLLAECYEKKGLKEEAKKAYQDALRVQPNYNLAQVALDRLASS